MDKIIAEVQVESHEVKEIFSKVESNVSKIKENIKKKSMIINWAEIGWKIRHKNKTNDWTARKNFKRYHFAFCTWWHLIQTWMCIREIIGKIIWIRRKVILANIYKPIRNRSGSQRLGVHFKSLSHGRIICQEGDSVDILQILSEEQKLVSDAVSNALSFVLAKSVLNIIVTFSSGLATNKRVKPYKNLRRKWNVCIWTVHMTCVIILHFSTSWTV